MKAFGGIETGGTKCVCLIGNSPKEIIAEKIISTESPGTTIKQIIDFFNDFTRQRDNELLGIGLASFGPIDLNERSSTYGFITSTPKPYWSHVNILGELKNALEVPVHFETDTNGAAIGEWLWGAGKGLDNFIYLTIGTGIGGGGIINGKPLHGLVHPEMGHILVPHNKVSDPFEGGCPFHQDCFEGLASGPAIESRWGKPSHQLCEGHPAWELEAQYIALGLQNLICTLSPQRIILGGGVMKHKSLFPMIRKKTLDYLSNYIQAREILVDIDQFIVPPLLGDRAGVIGALALAIMHSR